MWELIQTHPLESVLVTLFAGGTLVQISPIKINPWSWLARKIGRAVNGEMQAELAEVRRSLQEHIRVDDERNAKMSRLRILRFNDECLQGVLHTKEHYDEILDDVTEYERYCELHPGYRNSKAGLAISTVKSKYQEHLTKKDFL